MHIYVAEGEFDLARGTKIYLYSLGTIHLRYTNISITRAAENHYELTIKIPAKLPLSFKSNLCETTLRDSCFKD